MPKEAPTQEIPSTEKVQTKQINVTDFGAKPDDNKDDTVAFQQAIEQAKSQPTELIVPEGVYDTNKTIEVTGIQHLHIKGHHAVIKPKNPMTNPPEFYAMNLSGEREKLAQIEIEGLTIDGSKNPQDLYFTMKTAKDFYKTPMSKGFIINNTKNVNIHNVNFRHMYGGYAIHLDEYRDVNIHHINLKDVGGDDITDSFGMVVYLGGHKDDALVNIDRVVSNAKTSKRSKEYMGWIGVVLENGSIQSKDKSKWLKDQNTTVNVTNSTFNDYETTFHVESTYGNVYFNSDNIKTRTKSYFIAAGINGEFLERSNQIELDLLPYGRNKIVHGVYYTEGMDPEKYNLAMYNSTVNNLEIDGKSTPITAVYGHDTIGHFYNTTFNGVNNALVYNASGYFKDSVINLTKNNNKDKLGVFSKSSQKLDLGNSQVNVGGSEKASNGKIPDKVKASDKPVEESKDTTAPAEIK
ncbi:glycoside hydrolase family 55 protein [Macrococcus brunensis]|uniref:glycoside hydrolase family 55 protein n=1 Tax=Macrococcus brunensis TaxID=198483 RepID=UPI001EF008E3|nr:glycoside hydrolase family 55 protein [Macrococcus brunensis]ULG73799.1 glycoside hydrolase family 55 protein [Macrococcus brunensis]